MAMRFPSNPYEDVEPSEFNKDNKKHASEYFVAENFKRYGWFVYEPFTDTGIDRIIEKRICPDGHTKYDDDTRYDKQCRICGKKPLEKITRFIQIKTREIKELDSDNSLHSLGYKFFGFTLSSADFRTDPRHIFLLYSDNTTSTQQDVHIIPISKFFEFMINNINIGTGFFSVSSFRVGNNKQNFLHYKPDDNWVVNPRLPYICFNCTEECSWRSTKCKKCGENTREHAGIDDEFERPPTEIKEIPFNDFRNEEGLKLISTKIGFEDNLPTHQTKIAEDKLRLYFDSSKLNPSNQNGLQALDLHQDPNFPTLLKTLRDNTRLRLMNDLDPELRKSVEDGYFVKFKELRGFG